MSSEDDLLDLEKKVRNVTGLVSLQGPVFWSQQHLVEQLSDPLAKRLTQVLQSIEISKRDWKKVLKKLSEDLQSED